MHRIIERTDVPAWVSGGLPLLTFTVAAGAFVNHLYTLYYGPIFGAATSTGAAPATA